MSRYMLEDCCVNVLIPDGVEPVLTIESGEVDPFDGEEVGFPAPRVYWSNGTITEGSVEERDADG